MDEDAFLRLGAMVTAQEALLVALFKHANDRISVLQHYTQLKDGLANVLLFDPDIQDKAVDAINHAHEHLLTLLTRVHS